MRPLKRLLQLSVVALVAGIVMFFAPARHAEAEGINISWDECGTAGTRIKSFACNSGSTTPIALIGSFQPPPGVQQFLGTSSEILIAGTTLPNWWALQQSGCRSTALTTDFHLPANGACVNLYDGESVGGLVYYFGWSQPNAAQLLVQTAIPINKRATLDPTKEYYGFKLLLTPDKTAECAGCTTPISVFLNRIQLFQPPDAGYDPIITRTLSSTNAYWQGETGNIPELISVAPNAGVPGDNVVIHGRHFGNLLSVRFGGTEAQFSVNSSEQVTAIVPQGVRTGLVGVSTLFGSATSTSPFIIKPALVSFLPEQAPVGTEVNVLGINFTGVTEVRFGSVAAVHQVISDSLLRATVPPGAVEGPVTATNPGGSGTTGRSFRIGPVIGVVNLAWDDCGAAGVPLKTFACNSTGDPFELYGSFAPPEGVTKLMGIRADLGVFSTLLPDWWKHGAGQCRENAGLTVSFDFADDPKTCADPWLGQAGGTFTYELNYYGPNSARIAVNGAMPGTRAVHPYQEYNGFKVNVVPTRRLSGCAGCDLPVQLQLEQIQLIQAESEGFDPVLSTALHRKTALWQGAPGPQPQITSISPRSGTVGILVNIEGINLTTTSEVLFDTKPASVYQVVTDRLVQARVPPDVRTGPILVRTTYGVIRSDSLFIGPPNISGFSPGQAPIGHTIAIDGYNFTGTEIVTFRRATVPGFVAATFTVISDSRIEAQVPIGAVDGPIYVSNPAGRVQAPQIFHVGTPLNGPVITSFSPLGGKPGASVVITGERFIGTTSVKFGTLEAGFVESSPTRIEAVIPADAVTARIQVTTPGGSATSELPFTIAPSITSFAPNAGPPGTRVVLRGRSFKDVTLVQFAGDAIAGYEITSDSVLVATAPAEGVDGPIRLTNPGGSTATTTSFEYETDVTGGKINLSWDDCGDHGEEDKSFVCNTNTGGGFTMVGSFVAPSGIAQFLGASAELRVESKADLLPDWWKFGSGTCRGGNGFSADFSFVEGPYSCEDATFGRAAGGYVYEVGRNGPNSARIRLQYAVPFEDRGPLTPGVEYYAFKVRVSRSKVVGVGACSGCNDPVNVTLREIQLFQPPQLGNDPVLATPGRARVHWQPSHNGPNLVADPSFEQSTGPWVPVGGATLSQVAETHDGANALNVAAPDTLGEYGINDSPNFVPVTPAANRLYRFSAWVRSTSPGLKLLLRSREYLNKVRVQVADTEWLYPEADWKFIRGQITTMHATSALDFQIIASGAVLNSSFQVDDVEVALLGTIPEIKAPREIEARVGEPVEFEVTVKDLSGEPIASLKADLSNLPMLHNATFTLDPGYARGVFRWTPQPEDEDGSYTIPFTAVSVLDETHSTRIDVHSADNTENRVTNASFEEPPTKWIPYNGATFERVESGRSGSWSLEISQPVTPIEVDGGRLIPTYGINDRPNWLRTIPAAGIPIRYACWVRGDLNTGTALLRVREYLGPTQIGSTTFSQEIDLSPTWTQLVVDHVTGAAGSTLDLQILCGPLGNLTKFGIDDVSIRPLVPMPVSDPAAVHETGGIAFDVPTVFPNPFRGNGRLGLTLQRAGPMRVDLYDLHGRRVRNVFETEHAEIGTHHFTIDGMNERGQRLEPGMFFYRIESAEGTQHGRFVILE